MVWPEFLNEIHSKINLLDGMNMNLISFKQPNTAIAKYECMKKPYYLFLDPKLCEAWGLVLCVPEILPM